MDAINTGLLHFIPLVGAAVLAVWVMDRKVRSWALVSPGERHRTVALLLIAALLLIVGTLAGVMYPSGGSLSLQPTPATGLESDGERDERDERGCLFGMGYSWCEAREKCLRAWEEVCTTATDSTSSPHATTTPDVGPEICVGIPADPEGMNQFSCYSTVAVAKKDASICDAIAQAGFKEQCSVRVAESVGSYDLCDASAVVMKEQCVSRVAIAKRDAAACASLDVPWKDDCYRFIAAMTQSPALCRSVTDQRDKDLCYRRIAIDTRDADVCDRMSGKIYSQQEGLGAAGGRAECYQAVAVAAKQPSACDAIEPVQYVCGVPSGATDSTGSPQADSTGSPRATTTCSISKETCRAAVEAAPTTAPPPTP